MSDEMNVPSSSTTTTTTTKEQPPIPIVAKTWLFIYYAIPKLHVPTTNLNISFALFSALFLTSVRYLAEYVLIQSFGWPTITTTTTTSLPTFFINGSTATKEAAGSCAAICHSSILCLGLLVAFATQKCDPVSKRMDHPQWWQDYSDALLQFCTGYMIYDAIINILLLRWDPQTQLLPLLNDDDKLFLVHHMMTSFYMTSSRLVGAGHMSAMVCMLVGEATNPLHNLYMMGEVAMTQECCNGPTTQSIHAYVSVAFAATYYVARAIVSPITMTIVSYCLIGTKRGRTNIPLIINIVWNILIWAVIFGSYSWIIKCQGILVDFLATTATTTTTTTFGRNRTLAMENEL
jgi:hypothetical protein